MNLLVSVVIATRRRPGLLARCLAALLMQTLPPEIYEIVVADDDASPQIENLIRRLQNASTISRYVAVHGEHGPAAARNAGWRASRSPIIAFTDDDTIPDANWLAAGLAAFDPGVAAVSGRTIAPFASVSTGHENRVVTLEAQFLAANCFCRRDILEVVGGFDGRFHRRWHEESDLYFSLLERGLEIRRAADALVVRPARLLPLELSLTRH